MILFNRYLFAAALGLALTIEVQNDVAQPGVTAGNPAGLARLFPRLDSDRNGQLSAAEFRQLAELGQRRTLQLRRRAAPGRIRTGACPA
ncbi:MAG: hypothetical protein WC789_11000 [Lentisphaeria bacterium]